MNLFSTIQLYIVFLNPQSEIVSIFFPVAEIHSDIRTALYGARGADGPAEKALDLPALSRFGEGRAEHLMDWIRMLHHCTQSPSLVITKVTPNISTDPRF